MFGRLLGWYITYTFLGGFCPLTEFCQVQTSLCVQVLRSPILAALLHGTRPVGVSQTLRRGTRNGITELSQMTTYSAGRPSRWASAHILEICNVMLQIGLNVLCSVSTIYKRILILPNSHMNDFSSLQLLTSQRPESLTNTHVSLDVLGAESIQLVYLPSQSDFPQSVYTVSKNRATLLPQKNERMMTTTDTELSVLFRVSSSLRFYGK